MLKLQNGRSHRIFAQNTSEFVRLKALDLYFLFLQVTSTYEHFTSIYEHLRDHTMWDVRHFEILKNITLQAPRCSWMLVKCSEVLVGYKNAKYRSRAFKRTNSQLFSISIRPERADQSLVILGKPLAENGIPPLTLNSPRSKKRFMPGMLFFLGHLCCSYFENFTFFCDISKKKL